MIPTPKWENEMSRSYRIAPDSPECATLIWMNQSFVGDRLGGSGNEAVAITVA